MKRALMYATVASMIDLFNMDNIKILHELGYQVDIAANFQDGNVTSKERINQFKEELSEMNVSYYHIPIPRSITNISDLKKSYNMTMKLKEDKEYDLVHCHTPIGSAICRAVFRNSHSRVLYTAHGFHFYKGAPLKNWLIYYPIERILSKYTDTLITINHEDCNYAQKFQSNKKYYVPGVGIDLENYTELKSNKSKIIKKDIGLDKKDILFFSTGELNQNKNHEVIFRAIANIKEKKIHYAIAGQGPLKIKLYELAEELNIKNQIHLLGYRNDIPDLLNIADVFVFPSIREGLSASLMEAMATGLPVIASEIRGNIDLIDGNQGGYLLSPDDISGFSKGIKILYGDEKIRKKFGLYNKKKIKEFSNYEVNKKMRKIYLNDK